VLIIALVVAFIRRARVTLIRGNSAMTVADCEEESDWSLVQKRIAGTRTVLFSKRSVKRDKHSVLVEQRARKSANYRKVFSQTLQQIDLTLLVREMREDVGFTLTELARKIRTTQSAIARLEGAEYAGHSLTMLERIAMACGVALKLHAEKKPHFDRKVALLGSIAKLRRLNNDFGASPPPRLAAARLTRYNSGSHIEVNQP